MVANLILLLLCSLKTYLSFEAWKHLLESRGYLIQLSFSFFRRAFKYLLFSISRTLVHFFQLFFFMNNFCIAHASFLQQTFERQQQELRAFIWWMENLSSMFFVFTPSVGVEHFLGGSRWKAYICAYPQCRSSAYLCGVYVILILRA